ncbi:GIY-YIG catalytic domain-containing endonuclease [Acanthocystis turfacea Chlorella virus WI0606]|nr:GIY-YIG catalytic domain-containing endonuclease [Acanthocystis turfacea Chlorella virus WI0606]
MGFIYIFTSPKNKSYVGQTIRPIEERFKEHILSSSGCKAIYGAIQKYGWENMKKEWREVPDDELNFYEEILVALLGTLAPSGYNLREGGGSGRPCEEVKQKISKTMTGRTLPDEVKQKMSKSHAGTKTGEDNHMFGRTGENHHRFGSTHTEEARKKMSDANIGENNPSFGRTGEDHPNSKKVYQYAINGTFVQSFASSEDAARSLNKTSGSGIGACAIGKRKSAYGFKWSFTEL